MTTTDPTETADPTATAGRPGSRLPALVAPFRSPAYRRLAVALVLSLLAQGMWALALVWQVIGMGGGPLELSIVSTASAVGMLLPGLVGGVAADRIPQKRILLAVGAIEATGMGFVAVVDALGRGSVPLLAAVAFALGVAMAFYYPAYSAWLPALVPEEDLLAVNGFEGMARPSIAQALGPAVAGAVIAAGSPAWAVTLAAVSSALGLLALLRVPETPLRHRPNGAGTDGDRRRVLPSALGSAWHDVAEGFAYMVRTPWFLWTLLFACLMVLLTMGPLEVLMPFVFRDRLEAGPREHSWMLAAFGIGAALASLGVGSIRMPRRYLTAMVLGWGVAGLPFVVIAFADRVWIVIAAGLLLGAMYAAPGVIWGTLLQRRVPPALLGRAASLDFFVSMALLPVSMALAGPAAQLFGLTPTLIVAGAVPLALAVLTLFLGRMPRDEIDHPLRPAND